MPIDKTPIKDFIDKHENLKDQIMALYLDKTVPSGEKFDRMADIIFRGSDVTQLILDITDWTTVKKDYAKPDSPFSMLLLLAYRQRYVDRLFDEIRDKVCKKKKGWSVDRILKSSVGSTDLTSDYDITVGTIDDDVSGAELDVIEQFNNRVRKTFGQQPGTIFDTNLYAKGFLPVKEPDVRLTLPAVREAMYNMLVEGQDEGALVKQRRYMPYEDWDTFLNNLLREVGAPSSQAWTATRKRYETADDRYLIYLQELLGEFDRRARGEFVGEASSTDRTAAKRDYAKAKAKVDEQYNAFPSAKDEVNKAAKDFAEAQAKAKAKVAASDKAFAKAQAKVDKAFPPFAAAIANLVQITQPLFSEAEQTFVKKDDRPDMIAEQLLLRHKALKWEHDESDLVMWATNDLYISKMRKIRKYQQKVAESGKGFIQGFRDWLNRNKVVPFVDPTAPEVRVADLISAAIFFASEAYLSEGPLSHVVEGVQAARAKGTSGVAIRVELMKLTPEQLLQSINEQFGDFLKDFAHYDYGQKPEFLFRGAKYLQRLFEAADILSKKKERGSAEDGVVLSGLKMNEIDQLFAKPAEEILKRLDTKNHGLLAVRKGDPVLMTQLTTVSLRDDYCKKEVTDYFGAKDGTDLKNRISDMVLLLNAQVRKGLTSTPTSLQMNQYFQALG